MGRNGRHRFLLLLLMAVLACAPLREGGVAPETLERYLEIEVRVHFPNDVHLLVNPRSAVEKGYEQVRGRAVHGKSILINREMQLSTVPEPPLVVGRGRGGLTIRIDLRQLELPDEEQERVSFTVPSRV